MFGRILFILFFLLYKLNTFASFSQSDIAPDNETISKDYGADGLKGILEFFRDSIFSLMLVVALGVFLFIGVRLIAARGKPDEFKKAIVSFIYAIIGIIVITFSWAIIKFASGINF